MVQGQFCGDCLYMRYGEHVLESNENPDWVCPVCRGICNCSLCRQAKGWAPTGALYRKISSLGYKSVAHYLILTRLANLDSDENVGTKVPISSKRSLPFMDIETTAGDDDLSKARAVSLNIDHPPSEVEKEHAATSENAAGPPLESVVITQPKDEVELPMDPELKQCDSEYDYRMEPKRAAEPPKHETPPISSDYPEGLSTTSINNGIKKEESMMNMDNGDAATNACPKKPTEPLNDETPPASSDYHGELLISNNRIKKEESMNMGNGNVVATNTTPRPTTTKNKCVVSQLTPDADSVAGRLRQRQRQRRINPNAKQPKIDGKSVTSRLKRRRRT